MTLLNSEFCSRFGVHGLLTACRLRKIGAGRVAKDAAVSTDEQVALPWNVDEAEAAVTLCQLHDFHQPVADHNVSLHHLPESLFPS